MVNTNAIDSIQCGSDANADAASVDNNVVVVEKELTSCEQKQRHSPAETEQSLSEDDEELPSTSQSQLQLTITHSSLEEEDESAVEVEVNEPTVAAEMSETTEVTDCIEEIVEATSTSASAAVVKESSAEEGPSETGEQQLQQQSSMAPVGENASISDDSADIDRQVQVPPTALEAATDVTTLSADEQSNASNDGTDSSTQCTKSNGGPATPSPLIESEPEIGEAPSTSISNQQSTPLDNSILDDTLFDGISDEEDEEGLESASIILSDAGESKCASTAPVINLSVSGEEGQDEKLMALGVFVARAAHTDDTDGEPQPANQGADNSQPCLDDGSAAAEGKDENTKESNNTTSESGPTLKDTEVTTTAMASPRLLSPIQTVPEDGEATHNEGNAPSVSPSKSISTLNPPSPNSSYSSPNGYDKKRLNERLKQRLAKRAASGGSSPTKSSDDKGDSSSPTSKPMRDTSRSRAQWETRLQAATRSKRRYHKSSSQHDVASNDTNEDGSKSDILSRYNRSATDIIEEEQKLYPDTVTFSDGEEEQESSAALLSTTRPGLRIDTKIASRDCRTAYRKCASEAGASLSLSTRASRSKLSRHHHPHHHGIGILQADGIVYDDAMLLRLARQARYGRLRGEVAVSSNAAAEDGSSAVGERRMNEVKIHVYDLLMKDAMVEMPYFNCNFPIGQCFKAVNDGCHMLGTGAYHVGVEVNGVEYAFGANNIIGMSGIFTCVPKESPGYAYRETLDFGKMHTTKRTWIRVPKSGAGASIISAAFASSTDADEKSVNEEETTSATQNNNPKDMKHLYSFREVESFADGHAIIHSMAREYMGTDYDLLRKNCCTFSRDVCLRLGVQEGNIPSWFHNAAKAGADAEDAITSVEYSVRNMLDCGEGLNASDLENYNHGFEIIPDTLLGDSTKLKVVESPSMRTPRGRKPLSCIDGEEDDINETASWTY